jgi:uncharacterized protein (DUF58 family)
MAALRGSWPWALALAVLALAGGLGAGFPALVHMAYLLLGLLLLCLAYVRLSLWTLDVEHRAAATRITLGDRLLEVYVARTCAPWPIFNVDVVAHRGIAGVHAPWDMALSPRGHEEWTAVAVGTTRGRYALGVARIATSDPFGLFVVRRWQRPTAEVIVHPRARIIPGFSLAAARAGDLLPARRSWTHMPVAGTVRPFAPGDASTRIHWLSSARHGLLMVKDSERSAGQRLWVALDLSSPCHAGAGEESTVEYGVEAAAYVAELAFKAGLDVGLLVSGAGTLIAAPARGRDQREHLLDLLAVARDGMGPGLAATIEEYGAARPSDALVLLTPALPPDLLDLCARLRRLGCGVAAVLLDAASFGGDLVPPDAAWLEAERIPFYTLRRGSL